MHRLVSKHGCYVEAVEAVDIPSDKKKVYNEPSSESGVNDKPSLETEVPPEVEEEVVDFKEHSPLSENCQINHAKENERFSFLVPQMFGTFATGKFLSNAYADDNKFWWQFVRDKLTSLTYRVARYMNLLINNDHFNILFKSDDIFSL